MGQQHFYVPDELEALIQRKAKEANVSVSRYLAEVVTREITKGQWPSGYFEDVFGRWAGDALERAPRGTSEIREKLK